MYAALCGLSVCGEGNVVKAWIQQQKQKLAVKWASEFGWTLVQIRVVEGTEYLVDSKGVWRRLACLWRAP